MKKIFFLFMFCIMQLVEAAPGAINLQPIHEAFVPRNRGLTPQELIGRAPPPPRSESQPPKLNPQAIWIPGYWCWLNDKQDFIWICGVWRLPPPERVWMAGYWKEIQGGWTWVAGAWMTDPAKSPWVFSKEAPPAAQNENSGNPPSPNHFWFSGYWEFAPTTSKFQWLNGSWQKFDSRWILEPAHWIWRPEGYLFVSTYWDWTLENRGQAYDCNSQTLLSAPIIAQQLIYYYPDYMGVCSYYWFYFPHYWQGCDCIPPWWNWGGWWSLPWHDHWGLWWWWGHPGFPAPIWLGGDVIILIPPPFAPFIDLFGGLPLPWFITPFGVPEFDIWIEAIGKNKLPLLTPQDRIKIIDSFKDKLTPLNKGRPSGSPGGSPVTKPVFPGKLTPPAGPATLPNLPQIKLETPPVLTAPVPVMPEVAPTPTYPPYSQEDIYVPSQTYVPTRPPHRQDDGIWIIPQGGWDDGRGRGHDDWNDGNRGKGHDRQPDGDRGKGHDRWPDTDRGKGNDRWPDTDRGKGKDHKDDDHRTSDGGRGNWTNPKGSQGSQGSQGSKGSQGSQGSKNKGSQRDKQDH